MTECLFLAILKKHWSELWFVKDENYTLLNILYEAALSRESVAEFKWFIQKHRFIQELNI